MEYDDQGRQKLAISFEGVVTEYVYDQYGRMSGQRFFASLAGYDNGAGVPNEVWTTTQDAFGRVLSSVRTSTSEGTKTTTYQYDAEGRTTQVASPEGTLSYTYDIYGRKTSTIVGTLASPQRVTSYTYDALGRLATVTEDLTPAVTTDATLNTAYSYELNGMLDKTVLPNGTIEDYVYDSLNRLDTLTQYVPDETPSDLSNNPKIAEYDYTVRDDGRRTGLLERFFTSGGVVENSYTWSYDAMNRLTSETIDSSNNALDRTTSWTFDLTGNRLSQSVDIGNDNVLDEVVSYTYDANDRLTREQSDKTGTASDTTTFYGFEKTQQSAKEVCSGLHTSAPLALTSSLSSLVFGYDLQGRMSVVTTTTRNGSTGVATRIERVSYDYNSMGIRVSAKHEIDVTANGSYETTTTTQYLTDHQNFTGYAQTIRETVTDQNGITTKQTDYTFGLDEISQTTTEVGNTRTDVFAHDGHGSVRALLNAAGAILNLAGIEQLFIYDAYGNLLNMQANQAGTNLLYSGEAFDSRIGQQYLRARWYDAGSGRFNRLDPFFGNPEDPQSFHKYLYAHSTPVNGSDPTGMAYTPDPDDLDQLLPVDAPGASSNAQRLRLGFNAHLHFFEYMSNIFSQYDPTGQIWAIDQPLGSLYSDLQTHQYRNKRPDLILNTGGMFDFWWDLKPVSMRTTPSSQIFAHDNQFSQYDSAFRDLSTLSFGRFFGTRGPSTDLFKFEYGGIPIGTFTAEGANWEMRVWPEKREEFSESGKPSRGVIYYSLRKASPSSEDTFDPTGILVIGGILALMAMMYNGRGGKPLGDDPNPPHRRSPGHQGASGTKNTNQLAYEWLRTQGQLSNVNTLARLTLFATITSLGAAVGMAAMNNSMGGVG